jgi:hypothetical protein
MLRLIPEAFRSAGTGSRAGWEPACDSQAVTTASEVGTSTNAGWDRLTGLCPTARTAGTIA